MNKLLAILGICLLTACAGANKDKDNTQTDQAGNQMKNMVDSLSYALGVTIGQSLNESGIEDIDYSRFVQAVKDVKSGDTQMSIQDADQLLRAEMKKIQDKKAEAAQSEGVEFLEKNKAKEGIQVTASRASV